MVKIIKKTLEERAADDARKERYKKLRGIAVGMFPGMRISDMEELHHFSVFGGAGGLCREIGIYPQRNLVCAYAEQHISDGVRLAEEFEKQMKEKWELKEDY